jgi:hypothetical protein
MLPRDGIRGSDRVLSCRRVSIVALRHAGHVPACPRGAALGRSTYRARRPTLELFDRYLPAPGEAPPPSDAPVANPFETIGVSVDVNVPTDDCD